MRILLAAMLGLMSMGLAQAGLAAETACPELTTLQRWAGYLSGINFLWVGGTMAVGVGFCILFWGLIVRFAEAFWMLIKDFADALGYVVSGGLIFAGTQVPAEYSIVPVMLGCILFAGSFFLMVSIREMKGDDPRPMCALFAAVWGGAAAFYGFESIGAMAVAAFMGALGYSIGVGRMSYAFGFEQESHMAPASITAFAVIAAYLAQHALFPSAPAYVEVFAPGAFWMGSLVGYTALLIMSNRWYAEHRGGSYGVMSILMLLACVGGIFGGLTFGVQPLVTMASAFFLFFLAGNILTEIQAKTAIGWGIKIMLIGGIAMGSYLLAQEYQDQVHQFITVKLPR